MAIKIKDLGIIINNNVIVLSDFHIGLEEALNKQGFLIPRNQFTDIINRLKRIINNKKFKIIVINGDLKHEFGEISKQEWEQTSLLLDFLSNHCDKIVLVKGNHDTIIGPIVKRKKIEVVEEFLLGKVMICHGHKIIENKDFRIADTIIIGHEHPSVSISNGIRSERFKCFLIGRFRGKKLIVMPSFNPIMEGTDVTKEKLLSPYIKNIDDFSIIVVSEKGETFDFGKVKNIKDVRDY
ncbi:MAG: metallophosphoesterase [Candidatus Woesearchaeota archaeon]